MRRLVGLGFAATIAGACASARLPAPTYVGQPTDALQQVDYPPPPARVELVPAAPPSGSAVWIDGEWTWQGRRWAWKPGRWIAPPAEAAYSPWTSIRDKPGRLYVAEGKWRDRQGRELPDPAPLTVGRTRGGQVVDPEGETVPATPNVPPQTSPGKPTPSSDGDAGGPETPSGATPTGTEPKSGPTLDAGAD
jgi:hypothetical protein